ncbi:MAG: hypothetical protein M1338_05040, partial [Patescibacteria group bacterium]|nr:hypothetical protein [Patescibacteria group bacterium]
MSFREPMPNLESENIAQKETEAKPSPEIKIFGKDIDEAMIKYAQSVAELNDIFSNKSEFASISDWQARVKDLDSTRKGRHDEATEQFLC